MKPWLVVSYYFMEYNQLLSLDLPPGSVDKAGQVPSYSEVCLKEKGENYFLKPSMSQKKRELLEGKGEEGSNGEGCREGDYFT